MNLVNLMDEEKLTTNDGKCYTVRFHSGTMIGCEPIDESNSTNETTGEENDTPPEENNEDTEYENITSNVERTEVGGFSISSTSDRSNFDSPIENVTPPEENNETTVEENVTPPEENNEDTVEENVTPPEENNETKKKMLRLLKRTMRILWKKMLQTTDMFSL